MSERCEVCGAPIAARCAGLDVPALGFCAKHAREHERECLDVRAEAAQVHWIGGAAQAEARAGELVRGRE